MRGTVVDSCAACLGRCVHFAGRPWHAQHAWRKGSHTPRLMLLLLSQALLLTKSKSAFLLLLYCTRALEWQEAVCCISLRAADGRPVRSNHATARPAIICHPAVSQ